MNIKSGTTITAAGFSVEVLGKDYGSLNGKLQWFWLIGDCRTGQLHSMTLRNLSRMVKHPGAIIMEPKSIAMTDDELLSELSA